MASEGASLGLGMLLCTTYGCFFIEGMYLSFVHAPSGTGKTMLVEKLASESGMVLLALTPSSVLSKWSGESEKMIRSVFVTASTMQPAIVFIVSKNQLEYVHISDAGNVVSCQKHLLMTRNCLLTQDEVDALAGQRGAGDDASSRRLLTELLLQIAMAMEQDSLYVFACTNRIQVSAICQMAKLHHQILEEVGRPVVHTA